MHRSSGRAYTTVGGSRTVPWYHLPTPAGVPKVDPQQCLSATVVAAPNGETYRPTIICGRMPPGTTEPKFTAWGLWLFGLRQQP